jgi:hypothetical protein
LVVAGIGYGQGLTARQLFYQEEAKPASKAASKTAAKKAPAKVAPKAAAAPAPSAPVASESPLPARNASYAPSAERPLGLRYSVAQVVNGAESEVAPSATFRSGDMVRVKVEGNRDGYLYVVARGSSGNWKPLFPAADINSGENRVMAHRAQRLPSNTQAFTFDEQAGQEQLFVIFSAEPIADVEALIPSLARPAKEDKALQPGALIMANASLNDEFVSRLRNACSRDLIVQTVTTAQTADAQMPENAVYVVSQAGGRVVADIRLEHR